MPLSRSILPLLLLLFIGCNTVNQHSEVVDIDPSGWVVPAVLHFEVADTMQQLDMNLMARCINTKQLDSIALLVTIQAPDGVVWSEPFAIELPAHITSPTNVEKSYRNNVRFNQLGEYTMTLQPLHNYKGIAAAGVNMIPLE